MRTEAIDGLATFRLARLVTTDTFPPILKVRQAVWRRFPEAGVAVSAADGWKITGDRAVRWFSAFGLEHRVEVEVSTRSDGDDVGIVVGDGHPLGELIGCAWCSSVWIAAGVLIARRAAPRLWDPIARMLALSAVAGIVSSHT